MAENFTKDQLARAKDVDLLNYVQSNYQTKMHGNGTFKLIEDGHDSLIIFPDTNSWYDFSRQVGGDAVAFLVKHENKNMVTAVKQLIGETFDPQKLFSERSKARQPEVETPFILPQKAEDNNRVFAYLIKTRGIDRAIVKQCVDDGSIYQSHEVITKGTKQMTFDNCIFVGKDENGEAQYASQRSMNDSTKFVLKSDVKNSQKDYGFVLKGAENADWLTVCESPIDALSIASINKMQGEDNSNEHILSLGGVSNKAIDKFLESNKNISVINICLDNDPKGRESGEKIKEKYAAQGYKVVESYPKLKDYNLDLSRELTRKTAPVIDSPPPSPNNNRSISYLTKTKNLNSELVKSQIESGNIYQTDKEIVTQAGDHRTVSNTVFVKRDEFDSPDYAISVSYNNSSDKADFKVEYTNENQARNYISHNGGNSDLLVFNNPISMMTHQSYLKDSGQENNNNYLCSIAAPENAVKQYLSDNPNVKNVKVMLDKSEYINAKTGQLIDTREITFTRISGKNATKTVSVSKKYPKGIDLNKDLQTAKSTAKMKQKEPTKQNDSEKER